jgi:hypothetical protein
MKGFKRSEESKRKRKETMMKKYGVENISQRKDIREQRKIEMKTLEKQQQLKNGIIEKYGVDNISKEYKNKIKNDENT